ncbi:MAG: hypothetical protein SNJ72_00050 [Fimbriimonadales bacterium]
MQTIQRLKLTLSSITLLSSWLLLNAQPESTLPTPPQPQSLPYPSQALLFAQQVEQYDPNDVYDRYKLYVVLRSQDVPLEQRKTLALRILTGNYPSRPDFTGYSEGIYGLWVGALVALSHIHMDDPSLIPFLEEYLPKWEQAVSASDPDQLPSEIRRLARRTSPNVQLARALLYRLKAVEAVPQVKSGADLEKRLEVMLKEAGLTRQQMFQYYEEYLERLLNRRFTAPDSRPVSLAYWLAEEYGRMLFHYAKRGIDVSGIVKADSTDKVMTKWSEQVRFAKLAVQPEQLIRELLKQRITDERYGQILVDEGVRVVPLIIQQLEALKHDRSQVSDTGMGLVTLLEALVTLVGKSAVPLLEPFTQDEREWLCAYAQMAIQKAQEGKVFGFHPSL